jgi:hypothetical protein
MYSRDQSKILYATSKAIGGPKRLHNLTRRAKSNASPFTCPGSHKGWPNCRVQSTTHSAKQNLMKSLGVIFLLALATIAEASSTTPSVSTRSVVFCRVARRAHSECRCARGSDGCFGRERAKHEFDRAIFRSRISVRVDRNTKTPSRAATPRMGPDQASKALKYLTVNLFSFWARMVYEVAA